ncbi:MAG TPA: tetratricopeptide repeat protein, partial [Gemmatimonadales bacterium]|nr:tetratricopeptide repeat protein [Gemmatimonadales bacterium]
MRTVRHVATVLLMTIALPLRAQQQPAPQQSIRWAEPKCDIKPNNRDVNQGMLYLKSATTSRDAEQKKKDLADAQRTLTQAVTAGGQDKNPAAWYYLGRYYLMTEDAQGTDSALSKAQALKPECKEDIALWRRFVWVPTFNAGIAAWQANNADSAIVAFRRAGYLLPNEPTSFKYAATLFYNTGHADSAVVYFRKAADIAATDPKFAQDRKDALFNLGRIQQSMQKMPDAMATYREYLALYPGDPEILAALGSAYMQSNQKDSAF